MDNKNKYQINLLSKDDKVSLQTGDAELDDYIKLRARQDMRKKVSVCFTLRDTDKQQFLAYYTLSPTSILLSESPVDSGAHITKYPIISAMLIRRLTVDKHCQNENLQELLLMDAFQRSLLTDDFIKTAFIVAEAKSNDMKEFYKSYGFVQLAKEKDKLYLPVGTVKKALGIKVHHADLLPNPVSLSLHESQSDYKVKQ